MQHTQQLLNSSAIRSLFIAQLSILYNAKLSLTGCLPQLIGQATFTSLKMALQEDLDETNRQMLSVKEIFNLMNESWVTDECLGMNAVIVEAYKQVAFRKDDHFASDMSILFYMSVIENLQIGASEMLHLLALKLDYRPYAQLVEECLDMVKENTGLFYCVTKEYLAQ
jgi:ferritin-like metal-binding protein YciE